MPSLSDQTRLSSERLPRGHYFEAFVSPEHIRIMVDGESYVLDFSDGGDLKGVRFLTLVANDNS